MDDLLLEDQIGLQFEEAHFPGGWEQKYLPEGRLSSLITGPSIIREFSRGLDSKAQFPVDERLISFIRTDAQKLLAITLITGIGSSRLRKAMEIFLMYGLTDKMLPVSLEDERLWRVLEWSAVERERFEETQWKFLVRIFREDEASIKIGNREILPFRLVNGQHLKGAFSDVWKVAIHKAHQEQPMRMVSLIIDATGHELTRCSWTGVAGLLTQRSKRTRHSRIDEDSISTANGPGKCRYFKTSRVSKTSTSSR